MTTLTAVDRELSRNRVTAFAALASGAIGVIAAALLLAAAQFRAWRLISGAVARLLFAGHDVVTVFQSLLLIPAVWVLYTHYRQQSSSLASIATLMGAAALCAIALLQSLWLTGVLPETLYMIPQGLVGVWLIAVNMGRVGVLPKRVTWLGILAGIGLILITASFLTLIGYFGFEALTTRIDLSAPQARLVNRLLHVNLDVGSWIGKPLYPIWVMLMGRRLFQPPGLAIPDKTVV